ncbi:transposable element Tcb2 transposase [Trichonephila clavipes]|nr:transposable element Tcb2 transposase [Trichonephila clavipes]
MARRNHLDDFTRGRMIGNLEEGHTVTSVVAEFGINNSVISRAWKELQTAGRLRRLVIKFRIDSSQTDLHIFDRGFVIGDRYYEKVLLPYVRLFRGAIGPDFILMDDNARPHRTLAIEELLRSDDIIQMDWPTYSPDLNPIEHVWDALGRRIAERLHHPENTRQLKQMLIEEWTLLPQEILHQLVLSMPRRCEATIAVRGGHIPY